jgi:AcrR family transcriptional regulator
MAFTELFDYPAYIQQLESEGRISRTFRRLDPARQHAVIDAILEEATERGPASLNIKEIARRAKVSVGSLYQYFPNRDGLLDFAIDLCMRYMTSLFEMSGPYLQAMPLKKALREYLSVGIEWGKTEIGLVRFFGRAAYQGDPVLEERVVRPVAEIMRKLIRELLEHGRKKGEISPQADLEACSRLVNGLMIVTGDSQMLPYLNMYFQMTDEQMPSERLLDALVEFIMKGLN